MYKYFSITFFLLFLSCGEQFPKTVIDKQDYNKGGISEEQGKIIFEHIKLFPNDTQISVGFIKNGKAYFYGAKRKPMKS